VRTFKPLLLLLACLALNGCYYGHLVRGELDLLSKREPITDILKDEKRDPALKLRLQKILAARAYASSTLKLPDNGSYTQYADVQRDAVLWNVFATQELSLEPIQHCFVFAGCIAYQGYFDQQQAQEKAASFKAQGYDVYVGAVPAYSTLGWFDDPVINTMMHWSDEFLISTVFHELAHQQLYVKNDTAFNESFASFVGQEGLRQYLKSNGTQSSGETQRQQREVRFKSLILDTRERLSALYKTRLAPEAMRLRKQQEYLRLRKNYAALRAREWTHFNAYDRWFDSELNNARLLPFGLYEQWVPAFAALYREQHRDWTAFYAAAKKIAELPDELRKQQLQQLRESDAGPNAHSASDSPA
jgi:predicted aminopeptidase